MEQEGNALDKIMPENTLEYYVQRRSGKKRNYVFDYGQSRRCDHPNLRIIARGGIKYRCLDCNYAFNFITSYQQPLHNEVIMAAFTILSFSKEFGADALGEVLRRPIGQHDGSPHKPVLPEGMSFEDVLALLDQVDVNTGDNGAAQLAELLEAVWEGPKEQQLAAAQEMHDRLQNEAERKALSDGDKAEPKARKPRPPKRKVSSLSA